MNRLSSFQVTQAEGDSLASSSTSLVPVYIGSMRLERAQQSSMQALQRVQKTLEERFSDLVQENTSLRQRMTSSTLQNRELILVQQQETGSLQEQLEATQAELARVREERAAERESFHQQIDALRWQLVRKEEVAISNEQEAAQTIALLRKDLQNARQEILQRMAALQTEKEATIQEVRAEMLQQIVEARADERRVCHEDTDRRLNTLKSEHAQALNVAVKKAFEEGGYQVYLRASYDLILDEPEFQIYYQRYRKSLPH